ncbi:hypothetical protein D3C85_1785560 [compost metagenome]
MSRRTGIALGRRVEWLRVTPGIALLTTTSMSSGEPTLKARGTSSSRLAPGMSACTEM